MITFEAKGIRLPNTNKRLMPSRGRCVLDPNYRRLTLQLAYSLLGGTVEDDGEPCGPPYEVEIYVTTYKDIDNICKATIDVLEHLRKIDNDRNVLRLEAVKVPGKRGAREDVKIIIRKAEGG